MTVFIPKSVAIAVCSLFNDFRIFPHNNHIRFGRYIMKLHTNQSPIIQGVFSTFFKRCFSGLSGILSLMSIGSGGWCAVASEVGRTGGRANSFFSMPISPGVVGSTISNTIAILVHLRYLVY